MPTYTLCQFKPILRANSKPTLRANQNLHFVPIWNIHFVPTLRASVQTYTSCVFKPTLRANPNLNYVRISNHTLRANVQTYTSCQFSNLKFVPMSKPSFRVITQTCTSCQCPNNWVSCDGKSALCKCQLWLEVAQMRYSFAKHVFLYALDSKIKFVQESTLTLTSTNAIIHSKTRFFPVFYNREFDLGCVNSDLKLHKCDIPLQNTSFCAFNNGK